MAQPPVPTEDHLQTAATSLLSHCHVLAQLPFSTHVLVPLSSNPSLQPKGSLKTIQSPTAMQQTSLQSETCGPQLGQCEKPDGGKSLLSSPRGRADLGTWRDCSRSRADLSLSPARCFVSFPRGVPSVAPCGVSFRHPQQSPPLRGRLSLPH